jgi:ketosteroid isomerase-like protein
MFNYQKFEKDFIEAWNSHDIEYLLSFYTDDLVYIHPGEHPRVIKGKEQFKKYLENQV